MMKATQEQLNNPQWWDENVKDGLDYCYTTGHKWTWDSKLVGAFGFADEVGNLPNGGTLDISDESWVLHCGRPEYEGNNEKHDAVMASDRDGPTKDSSTQEYAPKTGDLVDVIFDNFAIDNLYGALFVAEYGGEYWFRDGDRSFLFGKAACDIAMHKSDRDKFIEKALVETGAPEDWGDMFGTLYDAGFKAPESEE